MIARGTRGSRALNLGCRSTSARRQAGSLRYDEMIPASTCRWTLVLLLGMGLVLTGCRRPYENLNRSEIFVAAAANLSDALEELGQRFERTHHIRVIPAYGATGNLARQIQEGAPYDIFAAADVRHVKDLAARNVIDPESVRVYARGRLVLTWSGDTGIQRIEDLASLAIKRIAIPRPDLAPYGAAAEEALRHAGIWNEVQSKIVYAENVAQAKQYASTGNVDVAFTPLSLIRPGDRYVEISPGLFSPIEQAIGIVSTSSASRAAHEFVDFITGPEGQAILSQHGY